MEPSIFRRLEAWQKAMRLAVSVYDVTETFPPSEAFVLTRQMRRAAISIPSNIAEGRGRGGRREYRHFLFIARGSVFELQTQLLLATRIRYIERSTSDRLMSLSTSVTCLINGLIRHLTPPRLPTADPRRAKG